MPDLSKIKLPSGNSYNLKDAYARQLLAGGLVFEVCWDGTSTPDVTKIPAGVKVVYNETEYTGTKAASTAEPLHFYLVKSSTQAGAKDVYDEYAAVRSGSAEPYTYDWEKIGDTNLDLSNLGELAYKDNVTLTKGDGANVLGANATFSAAASDVTFASGAGSDFVTGYNNDAVLPSFSEGAFTPASLGTGFYSEGTAPSFTEGAFTPASLGTGFYSEGTAPSFTEGAFSQGTLPSFTEGAFSAGSLPSLGNATTGSFAVEGMTAAMGTGDDAETLILSAASTSSAVTAQGTFDAGSLPSKAADTFSAGTLPSKAADTFSAGTVTTIDTTKFSGGSKASDTFSAGTVTTIDTTKFSGGSKAADTFNAGSAATLAKAKAITASDTGSAAAQAISINSADSKKIALYDDLGVTVS